MFIFTGKEPQDYFIMSCEGETQMSMHPSGWMSNDPFVDRVKCFQSCIPARVSVDNPYLIIHDGHGSQMSEEVVALAKNVGVEVFGLSPHSSPSEYSSFTKHKYPNYILKSPLWKVTSV